MEECSTLVQLPKQYNFLEILDKIFIKRTGDKKQLFNLLTKIASTCYGPCDGSILKGSFDKVNNITYTAAQISA